MSAYLALTADAAFSRHVYGVHLWALSQAIVLDIPILPTICIQYQHVADLLSDRFKQSLLKDVTITKDLSNLKKRYLATLLQDKMVYQQCLTSLSEWYHLHDHSGNMVGIFTSQISFDQPQHKIEHIRGNVNFIESFLELWLDTYIESLQANKNHLSVQKHLLVAPKAIYIQLEPLVQASGVSTSINDETHDKKSGSIFAYKQWHDYTQREHSEKYTVDSRTNLLLDHVFNTQEQIYAQESDRLVTVKQTALEQVVITPVQAQTIALWTQTLNKRFLHSITLTWICRDGHLFVTGIYSYISHQRTQHTKTKTKILVSMGNPNKLKESPVTIADGVGIFKSEYTFIKQGLHPLHVITSNKRKVIETELLETVYEARKMMPHSLFLYRSLNLDSGELKQLSFASAFEQKELNPATGFRGGLRLLHQPQMVRFEVTLLKKMSHLSVGPLGYLLPYVRTASELHTLITQITPYLGEDKVGLWWQLSTAENVFNLSNYPLAQLTGIVVDTTQLHYMMHAVDQDNTDINVHYPMDITFITKILHTVAAIRTQQPHLQLYVQVPAPEPELIQAVVALGCTGIIVKPHQVQYAHTVLSQYEESDLGGR